MGAHPSFYHSARHSQNRHIPPVDDDSWGNSCSAAARSRGTILPRPAVSPRSRPGMQLTGPQQRAQGALLAGDWIAAIAPLMRQLSSSAHEWRSTCVHDAQEHYQSWLSRTPQERLKVRVEALPKKWQTGKISLVEQRAVTLLLKALPEDCFA